MMPLQSDEAEARTIRKAIAVFFGFEAALIAVSFAAGVAFGLWWA